MCAAIYLGDEATAAGYRLAGVQVRVPVPREASAALEEARALAPVVFVSAAVAIHIDPAQLRAALAALEPLVLIVPDAQGEVGRPDLAARLRAQLGMEA
ncbi:MAG: V-type ATP synthase subunit F [Casimicrobiaceae bacterium]